jgi:hypothetical protein
MNQSWANRLQFLSIRHAEACLNYDRAVTNAFQAKERGNMAPSDVRKALLAIARAKRVMEESHAELVGFVDALAGQQFMEALSDEQEGAA